MLPDCAAPARRSCWLPQARARHEGRAEESALRIADRQQGTAAWIGKYGGFWSGLRAQIAAIFGALGSLQLTVFSSIFWPARKLTEVNRSNLRKPRTPVAVSAIM